MMRTNTSRFSCADFTFPLLPHNHVLQLIRLMGFEGVDLGIFEDRSHHYPSYIAKDPEREATRLSEELDSIGLEASDVFLQTGAEPSISAVNSPDRSVRNSNRELFFKIVDFTSTLGCRHITGLPGVRHEGETLEEDWKRACDETNWRIDMAKAQNLVYAVEPHLGSILPDPDTTIKFLNECPDLSITLDYGHFIYQDQSNESVHALIPFTSHFHARGGAPGKLQTTVSENEIDFEAILSGFDATGYPDFICLEYVYSDWGGCNRTDNVSETILLHELLKML